MWALLNRDHFVLDCLIGISFEEAQKYEIKDRYLVEMTLENSPAFLGGYYDGKVFHKPLYGNLVEKDYIPQVYIQHGLKV